MIHQVYMHKQVRDTIKVWFNYSQPSTQSTNAHIPQSTKSQHSPNFTNAQIHQTHMQIRLMQGRIMHLYMIPICMRYHHQEGRHLWCNKNITIVANMDIKSVTVSHECMNIRHNTNTYIHTINYDNVVNSWCNKNIINVANTDI